MIDFVIKNKFFFFHLMSFALKCQKNKSNIFVIKNDVSSHVSKMQNQWIIIFFLTTFVDFTQNFHEYQYYEIFLMRQFVRFEHDKSLLIINETQNWRKKWIYFYTTNFQFVNWIRHFENQKKYENCFQTFMIQKIHSNAHTTLNRTNIASYSKNYWITKRKWIQKKATKMIMINEQNEIVEISHKNHIRFYNFEKRRLKYTKRKANVKSKYKDKWVNLKFNISQISHVKILRQWRNFIKTATIQHQNNCD